MFLSSSNPCVTWGLVGLRGLGRLGHQGSTADDLREAGIRDGPRSLLNNKSDAEMGRRRSVKMNPVGDLQLFRVPKTSRRAVGFLNLEMQLRVVNLIKSVELSQDRRVRNKGEEHRGDGQRERSVGPKNWDVAARGRGSQ